MDDFRELYRRIEYLRNNGIKMKEIADCAGMAPSILSSLYTTVLPTYFEELKNCSHEEALDHAIVLVNNISKRRLLSVLLFQDRFNGMIARKNALAGTKEYHVAFGEDSYTVVTAVTTSTFRYELIDALAESQDYTILLMKKRYVQPLDKRTLTGGTVEEFKRFLEEKTGKTFRRVK